MNTYGPTVSGDALANTTVGGPVGGSKCFIRFRAEQSSSLVSVRLPILSADNPGYGAGTGGAWRMSLHHDDGTPDHYPDPAPIFTRNMSAYDKTVNGRSVTMFGPPLVAGRLYHLVIENVDTEPTRNYFSINTWARLSPSPESHPRFPSINWGHGYFHASKWYDRPGCSPIAEIRYANGQSQGACYGEASYMVPPGLGRPANESLVGRISGTAMVRERFTVTGGDRIVTGVGVRVLKDASRKEDCLLTSIHDDSGEDIACAAFISLDIEHGPAPTPSLTPSSNDLGARAIWITATFVKPITLLNGATYSLRLASPTGTYWAWGQRRLTFYGYSPATCFTDGWAEYTVDGHEWAPLGRVARENDLQFFLSIEATP